MRPQQAIQPLLTWLASRGPLVLAVLGALLLAVAEFLTLYEVVAVTAVPEGGSYSAGGHHAYALLVVALASLPMAWGAVMGGSRPAALALLVLGALALFVVLAIDLPDINEEGVFRETYALAKATPRSGFWIELLGALVLLGAGVSANVLRPERVDGGAGRRERVARDADEDAPVEDALTR